jgi:ribosome-associated translation inhibitor RaiA
VDIIFHAHHAVISDRLQGKAVRALEQLAKRNPTVRDIVVRFEQDGPSRRVEVVAHLARNRRVVGEGTGHTFGPALSQALIHLSAQLAHIKRRARDRVRAAARA